MWERRSGWDGEEQLNLKIEMTVGPNLAGSGREISIDYIIYCLYGPRGPIHEMRSWNCWRNAKRGDEKQKKASELKMGTVVYPRDLYNWGIKEVEEVQ